MEAAEAGFKFPSEGAEVDAGAKAVPGATVFSDTEAEEVAELGALGEGGADTADFAPEDVAGTPVASSAAEAEERMTVWDGAVAAAR